VICITLYHLSINLGVLVCSKVFPGYLDNLQAGVEAGVIDSISASSAAPRTRGDDRRHTGFVWRDGESKVRYICHKSAYAHIQLDVKLHGFKIGDNDCPFDLIARVGQGMSVYLSRDYDGPVTFYDGELIIM